MQVTVKTVYKNIDAATLKFMIDKLDRESWPKDQIESIKKIGIGIIESKDPASNQSAVTTFIIMNGKDLNFEPIL